MVDNLDATGTLASGIKVQSSGGGPITNALDLSDTEIVNALSLGENNITASQFSITGTSGDITTAGDIAVNGGDITVATNIATTVFNTNTQNLSIGGAATTLSLGATTGTATIRNVTLSLPNATSISAAAAALTIDSAAIGGGYGSTGVSISNAGNIQANGTLTVDGASLLTGNVTTSGDLAVNGASSADITSTTTTATVFNSTVTNLSIGNAATTLSLGAAAGTTTVNGALTVASTKTFTANGPSVFDPDSTNDVTFTTDATSTVIFNGLQTTSGSILCVDSSNNLVICDTSTSLSLQAAYNNGNTITTTSNRNIDFTLANSASDSLFSVTTATDSTGYSQFVMADGAGTNAPAQLLLIDNLDTDLTIPTALMIQSSGGGDFTTGIDLSDTDIITALSLGVGNVSATNWSVAGSTGNITTGGDLAVNGGDLTTNQASFNLLNSPTTVNAFQAGTSITLGANNSGTFSVRNQTISFPSATAVNATGATAGFDTVNVGGGYGTDRLNHCQYRQCDHQRHSHGRWNFIINRSGHCQ